MSGSEFEPKTKATQSSRREDMPIYFIAVRDTALSTDMSSWPFMTVEMIK